MPDQCSGADAASDVSIPMVLATKVRNRPADDRECGECKGESIRQLLRREPLTWSFWGWWSLFEFCGDVLLEADDGLRELLLGRWWWNDRVADGWADKD